jgi:hypothetical protein
MTTALVAIACNLRHGVIFARCCGKKVVLAGRYVDKLGVAVGIDERRHHDSVVSILQGESETLGNPALSENVYGKF